MHISITRPADYMLGAWRAHIALKPEETPQFLPDAYPFSLPRLKARAIRPDDGYRSAPLDSSRGFDGMLIRGEWRGHVYSNGCTEANNPTSIDEVGRNWNRQCGAQSRAEC